jgi:tetratricopeptide (TPR) repeat protein
MADMVKRFQTTDLGFACGLETKPFYPFSLRIGWRDYRDNFNKGITAGFSLNFDKVNVAYSFSDILNSDDDQHIFSLGIAFGKIDNVGKAYEHYLGYYLRQAKENYDNKNYIAAKKQFEDILAVYPNEPITKQYINLLSKIVEQTDINFSKKIEKYIAKADKALLKNNLIKARKYYSKALLLDSKNSIAREGILNVSKKIEEQQVYNNRKKHQKEITKYWIKAVNYYDKGDFVYAKDEFNKILEIDPTNAGALQYLEFINKKIEKVSSLQTDSIFKQGVAEFNEGNYEKALSFFNAVSLADPSRKADVQDYINKCNFQIDKANKALLNNNKSSLKGKSNSNKQIKKEMKDIYDTGLEHLAHKDYISAFETFAKLKIMSDKNKIYDYNKQITNYINLSVREISKQLYEEGEQLEMKEQLEQAYEKYKLASKYDSSNNKAKSKLEQLKTVIAQKYYEDGLKYFSAGNKKQAISAMKKALQYEPNKIEVNRFLKKIGR